MNAQKLDWAGSMDKCDSCGRLTLEEDLSSLMGQSIFYCPPCYRDFERLYREKAMETEEAS